MTGTDPNGGVSEHRIKQTEVQSLPSTEALQLVAHDDRLAILQSLWVAEEDVLSFTDLRHEAGIHRSARFNYHLQQLVGPCLRHTEDGYTLTVHGRQFVSALSTVPSIDETETELKTEPEADAV